MPVQVVVFGVVNAAIGAAIGVVFETSIAETARRNQASWGSHCSIHLQFCQSELAFGIQSILVSSKCLLVIPLQIPPTTFGIAVGVGKF